MDYREWGPEASERVPPDEPRRDRVDMFDARAQDAHPGNAVRPREPVDRPYDGFAVRGAHAHVTPPDGPPPSTAIEPVRAAARVVPASASLDVFADERDYAIVMWWTAIWCAVPAIVYAAWMLTQSASPQAGCATVTGAVCPSPRADAMHAVTDHVLAIVIAVAVSFAVAAAIHRSTWTWRAITTALSAVIIGAGAVTLAVSAIG